MKIIQNKKDLIEYINQSNRVDYIFFWGHRKPKAGISKSCFSQWYESAFVCDEIKYKTAEHFMMTEKAKLFADNESVEKVIAANSPKEAKKIGRSVNNFDPVEWNKHRFEIVVSANLAKFSQKNALKTFLLNTGNKVLVEASPGDRIWGIGMGQNNENAETPKNWRGSNLLGFALMETRQRIQRNKN